MSTIQEERSFKAQKNTQTADIFNISNEYLRKNIEKSGISDEAALIEGYLLGDKGNMSTKMKNNIRKAGVSHMVAASGFHLAIFVGSIRRIIAKRSRLASVYFSMAVTIFFTLLTGCSQSILRACIVFITDVFL